MSAPPNTVRRVYNLPQRMHERILSFMAEHRIPNETEAAIRLLTDALAGRETVADMVDDANVALRGGQSPETVIHTLCSHPLVRIMEKDPNIRPPRWWRWTLANGQCIRFEDGNVSHEATP